MGLLDKLKSLLEFSFRVLPDAPPLTAEQERGLALGAMYAADDVLPVNALTTECDPRSAAKILDAGWGVTDATTARDTYAFLLQGGGHRAVYTCVRGYLNAGWDLTRSDERARLEQATREIPAVAAQRGERPDVALRYFNAAWPQRAMMQWHHPRRIIDSIAAWDAARVVHVSRFILDAGYLDPAEAWSAIAEATAMCRSEYASWEEFQLGFLAGRAFWQSSTGGYDSMEMGRDYRRFTSCGKQLLTRVDSPWRRWAW
ncbi:DUF1266 domain-containing protein [Catenulispora subtropica]|uniref:DUF1266 domain-containing protein n=1 Tax=Catenulispora subtropica TaxID=450798 RepID=A0ABN2T1K8_9ACTN